MLLSLLSIILACFCWGFVFVIPSWIEGYSALEISLGRFFIYGLVCLIWLLSAKRYLLKQPLLYWKKATLFGLASTVLCYTFSVLGMKNASPAISTIIFAMSPLTIAFVGNMKTKEYPFRKFLFPSISMAVGIVIVNIGAIGEVEGSIGWYVFGVICAFLSLSFWTWYAVDNSAFLRKSPHINPNDWSAMLGTSTFLVVALLAGILLSFKGDLMRYISWSELSQKYIIGCSMLGTVSTAVAFYFWNQGSKKLPISLVGQLLMLEIIFGLFLIFCFEQRLPYSFEIVGIIFMLLGVIWGSRSLVSAERESEN